MKSIKIAGLCLVSMLMMSMALASAASAAPLWLGCVEGTAATSKYSSNQCTKTEAAGKWESVEVSRTEKVKVVGFTLTLTDTKAIGGSSKIRCTKGNEGEGTVGPGNKGRITKAEVTTPGTNCKVVTGLCSKVEEVKGADLPWQTEIFETEGKFLTKIEADGNGEPGWKVKCSGVEDVCTSESSTTLEQAKLENVVSSGVLLVLGTFEKANKAKCTVGGAKAGEVEGQFAILLANGQGLSINPN
jgi:hypothetical protein